MEELDPLADHPRFKRVKWLNKGGFGFVLLARDKSTDAEIAIKFLPRGPRINKQVEREILNHKDLLHPHVIQFKGVFLTRHFLAIAMEYAAGGNLGNYIGHKNGLTEAEARWIFQQLMLGVDYIHREGVANRDIKLGNTLLDDSPKPIVKLCDFGFSKSEIVDSLPTTRLGTKGYLAPEVLFRSVEDTQPYDGKKVDIWSCGVLLYVMIMKRSLCEPMAQLTRQEHEDDIRKKLQEIEKDASHPISKECQDLIRKILIFDPADRPSVREIQQHSWYQTGLPPGTLTFNNIMEQQNQQSKEEIMALFEDARKEA